METTCGHRTGLVCAVLVSSLIVAAATVLLIIDYLAHLPPHLNLCGRQDTGGPDNLPFVRRRWQRDDRCDGN
jgi:hypothetical protein